MQHFLRSLNLAVSCTQCEMYRKVKHMFPIIGECMHHLSSTFSNIQKPGAVYRNVQATECLISYCSQSNGRHKTSYSCRWLICGTIQDVFIWKFIWACLTGSHPTLFLFPFQNPLTDHIFTCISRFLFLKAQTKAKVNRNLTSISYG